MSVIENQGSLKVTAEGLRFLFRIMGWQMLIAMVWPLRKEGCPFLTEDESFSSTVRIYYLMVTLSWSATFWWCRRMLIKVGSLFSFLIHQKELIPISQTPHFVLKFWIWLFCVSFISCLEWARHTSTPPPVWLLFMFCYQKSDGILCWMHISIVESWEGFSGLTCAYSGGLLHGYFFTQCKRLTTYALLLLHKGPPLNSSPMLLVSIHVHCSCETAYILN